MDHEAVAKELEWSAETMRMVNELTSDIKGKAFDPDWFLLRNRLEEFERALISLRCERDELKRRFTELEAYLDDLRHDGMDRNS